MGLKQLSSKLDGALLNHYGRVKLNAPLAKLSWFRCGGAAEVFFQPHDIENLIKLISHKPLDISVTVIGAASNLLIRDGGVRGLTIKLGKAFSHIVIDGCQISAGAGTNNIQVARAACNAGISGLEFLVGIPGSIGGSLRMNAGAYGREISDIILYARAVDQYGKIHTLSREKLNFSYRNCEIPDGWIFIDTVFSGTQGSAAAIKDQMKKIKFRRETSQPVRARTSGSVFINPEKIPAWKLIEAAGCRGLRKGGAMISPKHCNFLVNTGNATAADLETLGEDVRDRVRDHSGINLDWEIRRIGTSDLIEVEE